MYAIGANTIIFPTIVQGAHVWYKSQKETFRIAAFLPKREE